MGAHSREAAMIRTLRGVLALVLSATWLVAGAVPAAAGGGGCHGIFSDEATAEIKVAENCFTPTVARVDAGATVTWFSGKYEAPHTVTAVAEGFSAGPGRDLEAGERLALTFDEPGVYPYACLLHPGMGGAIVVGDGAVADSAAAPPLRAPAQPAGSAVADGSAPAETRTGPIAVTAGALLLVAAGYAVRRSLHNRAASPPVASP